MNGLCRKMIAKEPSLCNHSGPNTLKPHLYLGVSEWIGPHTDLTNPTDFLGSTSQRVNKSTSGLASHRYHGFHGIFLRRV